MLLENSNVSVADVAVGSTGTAITASFVFWADNPAPPVLTYAVPAATFILPISSASAKVSDFSPEYFEKSQVVVFRYSPMYQRLLRPLNQRSCHRL